MLIPSSQFIPSSLFPVVTISLVRLTWPQLSSLAASSTTLSPFSHVLITKASVLLQDVTNFHFRVLSKYRQTICESVSVLSISSSVFVLDSTYK